MRNLDVDPGHLGLRLPRKTGDSPKTRRSLPRIPSYQSRSGVLARNDAEAHVARCKVTHIIAMAAHSVAVLLEVYAKSLDGQEEVGSQTAR
jgi:hypothetical protein